MAPRGLCPGPGPCEGLMLSFRVAGTVAVGRGLEMADGPYKEEAGRSEMGECCPLALRMGQRPGVTECGSL